MFNTFCKTFFIMLFASQLAFAGNITCFESINISPLESNEEIPTELKRAIKEELRSFGIALKRNGFPELKVEHSWRPPCFEVGHVQVTDDFGSVIYGNEIIHRDLGMRRTTSRTGLEMLALKIVRDFNRCE